MCLKGRNESVLILTARLGGSERLGHAVGSMRRERVIESKGLDPRPTILLSANSFWNIVNFRTGLVDALATEGYRVVIAAPDADQNWAKQRNVEAVKIEIDRSGLHPVRDGKLIADYLGLFKRFRPNFYLGFTPKPNIYGSFAAGMTGVASIPNVSGLGTAFIKGGLLGNFLSLLYRIAFRKCPVVMFQNPDDLALFKSQRIVRKEQARLLPGSGVDIDHFSPASMPAGEPRFLLIGRLLGDKGVREFVSAARNLKQNHPNWRFQLLGETDEGNRTGIQAAELQCWVGEGVIEHLGHAADVRPHIAGATAVVLPSYREGLPRSLLEAAAMARPLIATDVPGNRQLVRHETNGLLCTVRDPESLAQAMERVGSMRPDQLEEMGKQARALVEREYSQDRVIQAYLQLVEQLAPGTGV